MSLSSLSRWFKSRPKRCIANSLTLAMYSIISVYTSTPLRLAVGGPNKRFKHIYNIYIYLMSNTFTNHTTLNFLFGRGIWVKLVSKPCVFLTIPFFLQYIHQHIYIYICVYVYINTYINILYIYNIKNY